MKRSAPLKNGLLPLPLFLSLFILCAPNTAPGQLGDVRCYRCHKELPERFAVGTPHDPVQRGDCFACHDAHGAARELRLLADVPELCIQCHETPSGKIPHDPVAKGACLACHDPHNSSRPPLLANTVPELCTHCHDLQVAPQFAHSRNCFGCHDPHAAGRPGLLADAYPTGRRAVFSEDAYRLCFGCHGLQVFTDPSAHASTGFRNERQNLHYVHTVGGANTNRYDRRTTVRRKPGLTCSACHAVHGSSQDKAVRATYESNGFAMYSIQFRRTEWEGTCVTGCHKPQTYHRTATEDVSRVPGGADGQLD